MAEFIQPRRQSEPATPSYVEGGAGRYEGDRSSAIIGEGLTQAFSQFIKATDENIQQNIADDIARNFDALNREAGVDRLPEANLMSGVEPNAPIDILPPAARTAPDGVSKAQEQARVLQMARDRGVMSETAYLDRMNTLLRTTRGRYPGYRHQVDQAFRAVTGSRGNELRDHLFAQRGREDPEVARYNKLVDQNRDHLPPDYSLRMRQGNPYEYYELEEWINRSRARDVEERREKTRFELDSARGAVTKENGETFYRQSATRIARRFMDGTLTSTGVGLPQLTSMVQEWSDAIARGQTFDAARQGEVVAALEQGRSQLVAMLDQEYIRPRTDSGDSFSVYVDDKKRQDANSIALAPLDNLIKAVKTGDLPLMKRMAEYIEATKDSTTVELLQEIPEISVFPAITEWMGEATSSNIARASGTQSAIVSHLLNKQLAARAGRGKNVGTTRDPRSPALSVTRDMDAAARVKGAEDYGNAVIARWKATAQTIDKMPKLAAQTEVQYMFGPDNLEFLRSSSMDTRRAYYNQVASPEITEMMLKLRDSGDQQSWETYRNWTLNVFRTLSDEAFRSLQRYATEPGRIQIALDPKTNRFEISVDLANRPNTETPFSESQYGAELQEVRRDLERVNRLIQNIVPVITAEGGNVADQVSRILMRQRVDLQNPATALDLVASGAVNASGPPRPGEPNMWDTAAPFRPPFRAPGAEQGVNQPGANRPLPKSGSISLGPYGVASIHGASQEDLYLVQRALNGALGMLAPTIVPERGSPKSATGPYIQLKSGARIHLPPVADGTLQKFAPQLQKYLPDAQLVQKTASNDDVADNVAQQARASIPERSITRYAGLSGSLDSPELDESDPPVPASQQTTYEPSDPALKIVYRGKEDFQYGRSATQHAKPFTHLVVHHAVGDAQSLVSYGQKIDKKRGGAFGYHFYIAEDGSILQGAPMNKRTNHISSPSSPVRTARYEATNSNSLGITLVNAHDGATPEQLEAAERLINDLSKTYRIPLENVIGHGEIQSNRMSIEGREVLDRIKANKPVKDSEFAKLSSADKMMILAEALGEA